MDETKIQSNTLGNHQEKTDSQTRFFFKNHHLKILIKSLINIARHAPNHHRTEPARFYLINSSKIKQIGKLFGEVLPGDIDRKRFDRKGKEKIEKEWGNSPGLLIVTCDTDPNRST